MASPKSDILGLSNAHTSMVAAFALRTFHVKRLQTEEAAINLFIDISEVQQVAPKEPNMRRDKHTMSEPKSQHSEMSVTYPSYNI